MKRTMLTLGVLFAAAGLLPGAENENAAVRRSVEKSLGLLQRSSAEFFKKSGCISCHNNSILQVTVSAARDRGFRIDEQIAAQQVKATLSVLGPHREPMLEAVPTIPASPIVSTYALIGLAAEHHEADGMTDALVHELAARQKQDGHWHAESSRPPLDQGDLTATALSARSVQLYPLPGRKQEFEERVAKARNWMAGAKAFTTQEKVMRLMGLSWTKADPAIIVQAAEVLRKEQREDGGWAQLPALSSDAYATGQALVALYTAGALSTSDKDYQRGVKFLIGTQLEDGSWHVKTRALGFQPYFEGGYPHGPDQWISAAGGAWATMALTLTQSPKTLAQLR
jgi:hypothetical protein